VRGVVFPRAEARGKANVTPHLWLESSVLNNMNGFIRLKEYLCIDNESFTPTLSLESTT
jgi:hypothetical protein